MTIDGKDFVGGSVIINGNKVIVDGVTQDGELVGDIEIHVHGDAASIETTSGSVNAMGNVGPVKTMSGDVTCGNVSGSVSTMSGDVDCGKIEGSVSTMSGNIRHHR